MAPEYRVEFAPKAAKQFARLPRDIQLRLSPKIDSLANDPHPPGAKRLSSAEEPIYRVRVGDYRIIYSIEDALLIVLILRVSHRRDIYRNL